MLIKGEARRATFRRPGLPLLLCGLVVGAVLGFVMARAGQLAGAPGGGGGRLQRSPGVNVVPPGSPSTTRVPLPMPAPLLGEPDGAVPPLQLPAPAPGEPELLTVTIAPADWAVLRRARDRALEQGIIVKDDGEVVPATVTLGSESSRGTARLKGDLPDHVDTDQWSLRFELDAPIRGMRHFSVQHPKTRGFVLEWLVMATARREGVLAPRADFVRVAVNGGEPGVYYLEEHFAKELLESQRRREGPIVRFDESGMWDTWLQHGSHRTGQLTQDLLRAGTFVDARISAFGEKRLSGMDGLNARLLRALQQARDLQLLATAERSDDPLRRLAALRQLDGRTVDDLFVPERLGRWLAIYTLFRAWHGLAWHQLRFYHDPVLDRLEPIVFDTGANLLEHAGELALSSPEARWLRSSDAVMAATFAELGRMTEPGWYDGLLRDLGPRLLRHGAALGKAGILSPDVEVGPLLSVVLPRQIASMREIVRPVVAAGFHATAVGIVVGGKDERAIEVEAWATTEIPTQISAFRFGNGRLVPAGDALLGLASEPDSEDLVHRTASGVLLPRDGRRVRFRFPIDRRLAGLSAVREIKRAIRNGGAPVGPERVDVDVLFRTLAETEDRLEPLVVRRAPNAAADQLGRPAWPTLQQVLLQHPFLRYDFEAARLCIAGRHDVDGDLVLPERVPLQLAAGAELRFPPGAVLLCSAILAEGTRGEPVRLAARDPAAGWGGLIVLGGAGQSRMTFAEIANGTAIERGGWQTLGAVTCQGAPIEFVDCTFGDARCEDSVNLVDLRFRFERCTFQSGPHDLFDGDFVDGEIVDCRFLDAGEDAIDVSGSQVTVRGCTFARIGDKAFSVGEGSALTASRCRVVSASIAAAAKDRSHATFTDLTIDEVANFALTAYVKKPEFGPARMDVTGLRWNGREPPVHLVQTGCVITCEGATLPTRDVDVDDLYRRRILGR